MADSGLAGLVLAAGKSRRFGGDKRLAKFSHDKTLLQQSISLIQEHCSLIVVVLRDEDKNQLQRLLSDWLEDSRLHIVYAKDAEQGMGHSLANGVESFLALTKQQQLSYSGLLVMLGDMPYIATNTIESVIHQYSRDKITYPCLDVVPLEKGWGHPVIFGSDWFPSLLTLRGDKGGRIIIANNPSGRNEILVDDANILRDIDTPNDFLH